MRRRHLNPTTDPGSKTGRYLMAWLALVVGIIGGLLLWSLATHEMVVNVRLTGHGFATYEYTETRVDPLFASAAVSVAAAGLVSWAFLLHRAGWRWRGQRVTAFLVAAAAIIVIAAVVTFLIKRERVPFRASEHYTSIDRIVGALGQAGIDCLHLQRNTSQESPYWRASATCDIRSEFGVPDGFDDVSIHLWKTEDARRDWISDPANEELDWVASPTWLVTCEFLPTCSDVRQALGGQLNVEY